MTRKKTTGVARNPTKSKPEGFLTFAAENFFALPTLGLRLHRSYFEIAKDEKALAEKWIICHAERVKTLLRLQCIHYT
jgi:hypothetical protein